MGRVQSLVSGIETGNGRVERIVMRNRPLSAAFFLLIALSGIFAATQLASANPRCSKGKSPNCSSGSPGGISTTTTTSAPTTTTTTTTTTATTTTATTTTTPTPPSPSSSNWWSAGSFLNTPLSGGSLVSQSATWVNQLYSSSQALYVNYQSWATPIYHANSTTPTVSVYVHNTGKHITVPYSAAFVPDNTADAGIALIDDSTGCEYEIESFDPATLSANAEATFHLTTGSGAHVADNGTTGSEISMLGGIITAADVNSGSINHALRLVTPINSPSYVAPATRSDGTHSGGIPEGQLMRLDPNLDLTTLGLNSFQLMVAKALQTYGAYDADSGAAFTLLAENPLDGAHYNTTPNPLPRTLIQHLQFLAPPPTATAGHIDSNTDPGCNQQH